MKRMKMKMDPTYHGRAIAMAFTAHSHDWHMACISYATANWMKSQWELAKLSTKNVDFINHDEDSKFKKLKDTKNVTKIMGFSGGGRLIWNEIMLNSSRYNFIGLIDPTTSAAETTSY